MGRCAGGPARRLLLSGRREAGVPEDIVILASV